jgi:hypothetical protein
VASSDPSGCNSGKKFKGKKRHILVVRSGFQVLPKQLIVERTIVWLKRYHRLARVW